ncbi:MAG TPA: hypothetical protein VG795_06375 [Acidimicrobiia bacterium]|nr:hypothetical protein [Acidimicrobiia bacterium]
MGDIDLTSTPDERIVAVFRDRDSAQTAADRARRSGGQDVAVDDRNDDVRALVGEMREETSESWGGPSVAIYTPEMARHIPGPTAAAAAIGAVLALPLAFLVGGDVPLIGRLILAMFSGAVGGGTIGFLAGGFLGARRRANLDLADERGVVVGVRGGNPAAIQALASAGAIRIDRVVGSRPVDTLASHEARTPSETTMEQPIPQDEP